MNETHEFYMRRCLTLAQLGQGKTHPNPMVGALVLDASGQQVGEGYHPQYGGPHAEVVALDRAGQKAQGGTLYVNLEPCNHMGKTPPCTDKILTSGISRVICGTSDPNPKVAGQGIERLKAQGLSVEVGVLQADCEKLNEAFFHFIQTQTPFVVLKQAMTLDGRIATRHGESQWITSPMARRWVHQLRAQSDAILTTAETVLKDNSLLTVRETPLLGNAPIRIVLDRQLRLDPAKHQLLQSITEKQPVWVFTTAENAAHPVSQQVEALGGQVFKVSAEQDKLNLSEVLNTLGQKGITQLLVEAGGELAGALLNQKRLQKLWLIYGNQIFADPMAKPAFAGEPLTRLDHAQRFNITSQFMLENSWVLEAYPL